MQAFAQIVLILVLALAVVAGCELIWPTPDEPIDDYNRMNRGW